MSFLDRSFELHFNERPFLNHFSYLFITKTTKERSRKESNFSILCRGNIIPKEIRDKDTVSRFLESVDQFERILNDSAFIRLERLTTDEIVGTPQQAGLIEKYFSLSQQDTTTLQDIRMSASKMRIGDNILCVHTLSDVDDLPGSVQTDTRYEKYSTDRSDCRLSFAAPVGLMLSCDHIYNQFLFIDDSAEILQRFEKTARNMHSLSKYSRANQLNKQWIDGYLDEAHSFGLTAIRCHCNVMTWSDSREKLKVIKNDTGSALALMGCKPRYNTIDAPTLYWAGIPGGEGDFPAEESFYTFIEQGVCFFTGETNYADSLSPFGIKMADRTNGKPLHLDISDEPMRRGIITNRNKLVIGPSGSGKSFFCKMEMGSVFLSGDDEIIVIDPMNEYFDIAQTYGGTVVNMSTYTDNYVNPLEMDVWSLDPNDSKGMIREKGEFMLGLCEQCIGDSLNSRQKSIIDRCVRKMYIDIARGREKYIPVMSDFYDILMEQPEDEAKDIALSLELFVNGSLNIFNHQTNVDVDNRFTVYGIRDLGTELSPITMLVMMESIQNRIVENGQKGKATWLYIDEFHVLLNSEYSAKYLQQLWKKVRKQGGLCTGITQNVVDLLQNYTATTMLANSEFVALLKQANTDSSKMAEVIGVSEAQLRFVTNTASGMGLIKCGSVVIPFDNQISKDTDLYRLYNTNIHEKIAEQKKREAKFAD